MSTSSTPKRDRDRLRQAEPGNGVVVVANVGPHTAREGIALIPAQLGLPPVFTVEDLLTGDHYDWRIGANHVRLDPPGPQTHIFRVEA
jgi:starch synthase (maltosyl-transferring)